MNENIDKKGVGSRIHDLRVQNYLSMDELSKRINVSGKSTINNWENGSSIPKQDNLRKLADYFHIDPKYIIYGSLEEYVYYFLTDGIWKNTKKYRKITNAILEYTRILTNLDDEINNYKKTNHIDEVNNKSDPDIKEFKHFIQRKKSEAINKVINSSLDEIVEKLKNGIIDQWNEKFIQSKTIDVLHNKTKIFLDTFKGQIRELTQYMSRVRSSSKETQLDDFNTIDDFLKSDYMDNPKYKKLHDDFLKTGNVNKQLIDDYYKIKLDDSIVTFKDKLNNLNDEYEKTIDKYNC